MALLSGITGHAQIVPDGAIRVLSDVTNNLSGGVVVGANGSFTSLILSNNCLLTNAGLSTIGQAASARSNEVRLVSSTARWRLGGTLLIGSNGIASRLGILNGGTMFADVLGGVAAVGFDAGSSNNSVLVADPGSRWSVNGALVVGSGAKASTLVISNGARVDSTVTTIGSALSSSNNFVLVTGAGSTWSNSNTLRIGDIGPGNHLIVSNGGSVFAGGGVTLGLNTTFSRDNRLTVDGGTLRVTNAARTATLSIRRGTNVLSAGLIEADQLLVTNSLGRFVFNGGTLSMKDSLFGNGSDFNVGDGGSPATLSLADNGVHTFANFCRINARATLAGSGTINGPVLVAGGTVRPGSLILGAPMGRIVLNNPTTLTFGGSVVMRIGKIATALTNDVIQVGGNLLYDGALVVSNIGPGALAVGDRFQLFPAPSYSGSFNSLALPRPGEALSWEDNLAQDGSLQVSIAQPAAVTLPAGDVTGTNATLNGQGNPHGFAATGFFQWGVTTNYGNVTPPLPMGSGIAAANFSQLLPGLAGGSVYHFRAVVSNSFGAALGADQSFQTLGPEARTLQADGFLVSPAFGNGATLQGEFHSHDEQTAAWFEWGPTTNYGNATSPQFSFFPPFLPFFQKFSRDITGLSAGVTYHFRCVASNSRASVTGEDMTFIIPFSTAPADLTGVDFSSVAWGDYDNDGQLDILLTGQTNGLVKVSEVWRNTGVGFVNANVGLPGVRQGTGAWGDFDNDGLLDLVLTGDSDGTGPISEIWRNTGTGFTNIQAGLPGLTDSAAAWGDYDGDGRLDLLLAGSRGAAPLTQLWRNTGGRFQLIGVNLPGVKTGAVAWGDYDNDGRLDLLLAGSDGTNLISQIWRNTGVGFSNINVGLPGLARASVGWGDYDNDGRLDILLSGFTGGSPDLTAQVWRNTGAGFTNINAGLPGFHSGTAAWGDYDNDGRLDILLTGRITNSASALPQANVTQIWRNTGNGFAKNAEMQPGVFQSGAAWGDYDNDGRLDFVSAGLPASGNRITQLCHNEGPPTNTPPSIPNGLGVTLDGNVLTFRWDASSDAQTPAPGLTYNLRIGTAPGASDLMGSMAAATGLRRLPAMGNVQETRTHSMTALPYGQTIYWSVQAVDTAFAGSAFAPEQSFTFNTVFTPTNGVPVPGDINGDGTVDPTEFAAVLAHLNGNGAIGRTDFDLVLSNYMAQSPFLQMTNEAGLGGTEVTFALTNDLAGAFSVEFTTNFADWVFLGPATPRYEFRDTNAPAAPRRFYRLRWP